MTSTCCTAGAMVLLAVLGAPPTPGAGLTPEGLLLVYREGEAASRELAEYYASRRGVPKDRLLGLSLPAYREEISFEEFHRLVRRPIREHLEAASLRDRVRCLVTFYGLPIRVAAQSLTPERRRLLEKWKGELTAALGELQGGIDELDGLGRNSAPSPTTRPASEDDYPLLLKKYVEARVSAYQRLAQWSDAGKVGEHRQRLVGLIRKMEGAAALLNQLEATPGAGHDTAVQQLRQMRQAAQLAESRAAEALARAPEDPARNEARQWVGEYRGLIGLLAVLQSDINRIRPEETQAAVDSELTLLWWGDYPKHRWVPNTLNWRLRMTEEAWRSLPAADRADVVLFVSRIDAPTAAIARRMIDQAITAEQRGLAGTVYIDARGLKPDQGHGLYDQNLRDLAQMLWDHTDLTVRLDNRSELFGPGRCPQTMLYCGWYSLRRYVDAFEFVPGAVGYHIASFEAISLKGPNEQGWCKRLLDDGMTATLGPVGEPYLQSFPLPEEFFGLLLTGRFTLVECYAYTLPFNSWMQMLLGDPLYRPFAGRGLLTVEQVYDPERIPAEFRSSVVPATGAKP